MSLTQNEPTSSVGISLKSNMLWNSCGSIVYFACQWFITIFVVRLSDGYDAAGTLSLAMSIYNIFSPLAVYRMYTYQVSDIKQENTVGEYFAFRVVTCSIAFFLCLLYAAFTCSLASLPAIMLYVFSKILSLLIDVLHGADQLNHRMDYIGKSLILQGVGTFTAFCCVFFLTKSIEIAFVGMAAVTFSIGILYDIPRTKQFGKIRVKISRKKTLFLLRRCLPIAIAAVACSAAPSIPRQYLSQVSGEAALGIYASIAAPVAIVQMGASYIYNPLLSEFSERYASGSFRSFFHLFLKACAAIAAIGVLCTVGFELCGTLILGFLFGADILPYTYLLQPAILCAFITAFVWFMNDLLIALRHFIGSFVGNMVALLISIVSTFVFVPVFDMNGVSFVGIAAYGVGAIVMICFLLPLFKQSQDGKRSQTQ